jgi:hypothetical protein
MHRQILGVVAATVLVIGVSCSKEKTAGTTPDGGDSTPPAECGNGVRVGSEQCDLADLAGRTCISLGYDGGTLACTSTCTFDFAGCTGAVAGPRAGSRHAVRLLPSLTREEGS